jgi:hypothetical protein
MTFFMSLKETFGAASRSSASLAWNCSRYSGGTRPTSRNDMTWPSFMAAPFIVPSAATICSAVSTWRRASAACARSSSRVRFAARVPSWRAACSAARRPTVAERRRREVGIGSLAIASHGTNRRPRADQRPARQTGRATRQGAGQPSPSVSLSASATAAWTQSASQHRLGPAGGGSPTSRTDSTPTTMPADRDRGGRERLGVVAGLDRDVRGPSAGRGEVVDDEQLARLHDVTGDALVGAEVRAEQLGAAAARDGLEHEVARCAGPRARSTTHERRAPRGRPRRCPRRRRAAQDGRARHGPVSPSAAEGDAGRRRGGGAAGTPPRRRRTRPRSRRRDDAGAAPNITSETSSITATIETAVLSRPPSASRLDTSTMYSFWPSRNRIRCTAVGRDEQHRRGAEPIERGEVARRAGSRDLVEARRERHGQQEREQDLHAGLDDADLLQQLDEVAVEALDVGLVALAAARSRRARRRRRARSAPPAASPRATLSRAAPSSPGRCRRAVGPAHPRLVAAVVVVAEQHERRRLAERGARLVALGSRPRQTRTNALPSHSSATVVGSVWPGRMTVSGGSAMQRVHDRALQVRVARRARARARRRPSS